MGESKSIHDLALLLAGSGRMSTKWFWMGFTDQWVTMARTSPGTHLFLPKVSALTSAQTQHHLDTHGVIC